MPSWSVAYWGWIFSGIVAGSGIAIFTMTINVLFWSQTSNAGYAQSIFGGIGNMIPGVFAFIIPIVSTGWTLFDAYIFWMCITVPSRLVAFIALVNPPYHQMKNAGVPIPDSMKIARWLGQEEIPIGDCSLWPAVIVPRNWILVWSYFVSFGGFMALVAWMPVFTFDYHECNAFEAGCHTSFYAVFCSLCRSLSGTTTDKLGGANATMIGIIGISVGTFIWGWVEPRSPYSVFNVAGIIITSASGGFCNAACDKWIPVVSPGKVAPVGGLIGAVGAMGGFSIPMILGEIAEMDFPDRRGYGYGLWVYTFSGACSLMFSYYLKYKLDQEEEARIAAQKAEYGDGNVVILDAIDYEIRKLAEKNRNLDDVIDTYEDYH